MPDYPCLCLDLNMGGSTAMSIGGAIHAERGSIFVAFRNFTSLSAKKAELLLSFAIRTESLYDTGAG